MRPRGLALLSRRSCRLKDFIAVIAVIPILPNAVNHAACKLLFDGKGAKDTRKQECKGHRWRTWKRIYEILKDRNSQLSGTSHSGLSARWVSVWESTGSHCQFDEENGQQFVSGLLSFTLDSSPTAQLRVSARRKMIDKKDICWRWTVFEFSTKDLSLEINFPPVLE